LSMSVKRCATDFDNLKGAGFTIAAAERLKKPARQHWRARPRDAARSSLRPVGPAIRRRHLSNRVSPIAECTRSRGHGKMQLRTGECAAHSDALRPA
jgi:hypothetical protein